MLEVDLSKHHLAFAEAPQERRSTRWWPRRNPDPRVGFAVLVFRGEGACGDDGAELDLEAGPSSVEGLGADVKISDDQ